MKPLAKLSLMQYCLLIREKRSHNRKVYQMTAQIQWIPQTERDFLASLTPPLAKAGARGRFSADAHAALAKARADGFGFIGDKGHPQTEVKAAPKAAPKVVTSAVSTETVSVPAQTKTVQTGTVDAKAARTWARSQGMTVGERGRLHPNIISAYLSANGGTSKPVSLVKTEKPKPVRTRTQKVAYGVIPRRKGDPKYLSEPVLSVTNCGKCKNALSFCPCETPSLPKHFGSGPLAFSRTEALALHAAATAAGTVQPSTA